MNTSIPYLCKNCGDMLEPAQYHSEFQSLYRYNSALRKLILDVKIDGNYRSLACLRHLFLNSDLARDLAKSSEIIVPAPSSLWSRLRGRIDLAWLLASSLSSQHERELKRASFELHWQFKKRSRISNREKVELDEIANSAKESKAILIIDDVVTSGHTLRRTASPLGGNYRFLTLASALH